MCFSASASFTASVVLTTIGIYTARKAYGSKLFMIGLIPLIFGIQQLFEGFAWIGIHHQNPTLLYLGTNMFYFLAYCFWPVYLTFTAFLLEDNKHAQLSSWSAKKKFFFVMILLAFLVGVYIFISNFVIPDDHGVNIQVINGSILYQTHTFWGGSFEKVLITLLYSFSFFSGLISANAQLRFCTAVGLIMLIIALILFNYARASVWCFFAAILSVLILFILPTPKTRTAITE